jgi:hypothetical protein
VGLARSITVCALGAALGACGGSKDENTVNAVDFVTIAAWGASAVTFTDEMPSVGMLAYGSGGNTAVSMTGAPITFMLSLPQGATGSVAGSVSVIQAGTGYSCTGPVTVSVTKHGTSMGSEVAGSLGPASIPCPIGPTPQTVTASFSITRI